MRIDDLIITPIALGDPPLLNAGGLHAPYALRLILELVTDAGIIGLSEIPGDADVLAGLHNARPALAGASVFDTHRLSAILARTLGEEGAGARGDRPWDARRLVHAASAIEVACLDAIGKKLGCRVADLLGGVRRDRVPFSGYLFFKQMGAGGSREFQTDSTATGWPAARQAAALGAPELVAQASAMVDAFGFGSLKVKAGILAPATEVEATLALRDTFGPDLPLRIDPNASWRYETALAQGRRLRGVIEYYEDPVRGQAEMARLRRELDIPLATNMCTTSFDDLRSSLRLGSEDIVLADHHFWGGLRASMELARVCGVAGRSLSMHSNSHAGISLAAMVHLGAALPALEYACDTHYPWQDDDVLAGGRLRFDRGSVALPNGPGLGVDLDRAALGRLHEQYLACGLLRRDDEVEMRKVDPDWAFQATRY